MALQRAKRSTKSLKKLIFMMKREFTFKETRQAASNLIEQTMVRGAFKALNKKIMKAKTLIDEEASFQSEMKAKEAHRRSKYSLTQQVDRAIAAVTGLNSSLWMAVDSLQNYMRAHGGTAFNLMEEATKA